MKNQKYSLVLLAYSFAALFVLDACTTASKVSEPKASQAPMAELTDLNKIPIIDAHTHLDFSNKPDDASGIVDSKDSFLAQAKEAGVIAAVAHSSRKGRPESPVPELKIIRCMAVVPGAKPSEAESALKAGKYQCLKVYLGYVYKWASDPFYKQFYKIAEKHGVPVVFHTGDIYDIDGHLKYADPMTIDEVAVEFRKVNFVIAHLGNPWINTAAEVAYKNPNVYLEVSALMIGKFSEIPKETLDEYVVKPVHWAFEYVEATDKMMFGTDWPLVSIKEYRDVIARAIPKEHWRAVFHDNAAKVFKINKQ